MRSIMGPDSNPRIARFALQRYSATMPRHGAGPGRLNIYVSRELWRQVKQAAARLDLSVSEYCAQAIETRLGLEEGEDMRVEKDRRGAAVLAARRFRAAHFGESTFRVSTAELLRAARESDER